MSLRAMHEENRISNQLQTIEQLEEALQKANSRLSEQNTTLEKQTELLKKLNEENKNAELLKKSNVELRKKNRELEKKLNEEQKNHESRQRELEREEQEVGIWKDKAMEWQNAERDQEKKREQVARRLLQVQSEKNMAEKKIENYKVLFASYRFHLKIGILIILFGFLMANKSIRDDLKPILTMLKDVYEIFADTEEIIWYVVEVVVMILVLGLIIYSLYRLTEWYKSKLWDKTSKLVMYYLIILLVAFARYIPINIFLFFVLAEIVYIGVRMYL